MNNSLERKKGAILSYASLFLTTIITIVYNPYMIRTLGQSEYGLYSLVASIISYLSVLDFGFGNALVVFTTKYRSQKKYHEEKKLHGMFLVIFTIIGIIAAGLGLLLYFNVDNFFSKTMSSIEMKKAKIMMLILTLNLAISFPFSIYNSIITAYEKFSFQKLLAMSVTVLNPILTLPLLLIGYKSIAMVIVVTLVNLTTILINYIYCKKKLNIKIKFMGFDKKLFKQVINYSFFIFLAVVVDKINWSVDQFILGAISGTAAVSLYSVATQFNSLFINLSSALSGVMLPKISKMVATKASDDEISHEFIKVGRLQYFIIFLIATGFILFGKEFIIWLFGEEYKKSYYIAVILITPLCIPLIQNIGISIMQAKNMHKFRAIIMSLMAVFNIIISIPLTKLYGGVGSAIGTSISLIVANIIIMNIYYYKKVGINIIKFWSEIIKMTIPFLGLFCIILLGINLIQLPPMINMLVFGSIYVLAYIIISYFVVTNDYEKKILNNFIKLVKGKLNRYAKSN